MLSDKRGQHVFSGQDGCPKCRLVYNHMMRIVNEEKNTVSIVTVFCDISGNGVSDRPHIFLFTDIFGLNQHT